MAKEHGSISLLIRLTLMGACLVLAGACTGKSVPPALFNNPSPAFTGTYTLMQKVRLTIPALSLAQSFNAALTIAMPERTVRVVALSGPGVTFFDVLVDDSGAAMQYIHPGFMRISDLKEHIFWTVRLVLLNALAVKPVSDETPLFVLDRDTTVAHTLSPEGRLLTAHATWQNHDVWTLTCGDYDGHWPRSVHLDNLKNGYSVQITTYSIQREP